MNDDAELREKVVLVRHTMFNDAQGQVAATMDVTGVHLDAVARRAIAFAPEIAAAIRAQLTDDPPHA